MIVKKLRCDICGAEVDFTNNKAAEYDGVLEYPHGWTLLHVTLPGLIRDKLEDCKPARYGDFEICPKHGLVSIDIEELTVSED